MSKQAIAFHEFATRKAHDGRFDDVADVRSHYKGHQFDTWINNALIEYRQYLTDTFPDMTLREAAELTKRAPQNV
jgi:hypothetical protein